MMPFARIPHTYAVLANFSSGLDGLLTLVVYRLLKTQGFTDRTAIIGSLFLSLQFPVLRVSWGMPSEIIGVSIGVLALLLLAATTYNLYLLGLRGNVVFTGFEASCKARFMKHGTQMFGRHEDIEA
jgi:hypothetical protein